MHPPCHHRICFSWILIYCNESPNSPDFHSQWDCLAVRIMLSIVPSLGIFSFLSPPRAVSEASNFASCAAAKGRRKSGICLCEVWSLLSMTDIPRACCNLLTHPVPIQLKPGESCNSNATWAPSSPNSNQSPSPLGRGK